MSRKQFYILRLESKVCQACNSSFASFHGLHNHLNSKVCNILSSSFSLAHNFTTWRNWNWKGEMCSKKASCFVDWAAVYFNLVVSSLQHWMICMKIILKLPGLWFWFGVSEAAKEGLEFALQERWRATDLPKYTVFHISHTKKQIWSQVNSLSDWVLCFVEHPSPLEDNSHLQVCNFFCLYVLPTSPPRWRTWINPSLQKEQMFVFINCTLTGNRKTNPN